MRINKISKSDSFDLYSHVLSDFLSKKNNLQIKTAGIGSAIYSFLRGGGRAAQDLINSLRSGGSYGKRIKELIEALPEDAAKLSDGTKLLDANDPKVITLWGDIIRSINNAAEAATAARKEGLSEEMIKVFWGSEDNLKLFYKIIMLEKTGASEITGLQKLTSFGDLYTDQVSRVSGLIENTPIVKDADTYEVFKRALARAGDDPDFLKKTPNSFIARLFAGYCS